MRNIFDRFRGKMECFFGLIGVSFAGTFIIVSAILTPNYSPLYNTVSSLGQGIAKTLFSIGFVTAGSLGIPFYIYLESTLVGHDRNLRRFTTGIAIFTCLCIAFVGILPDPDYPGTFALFHGSKILVQIKFKFYFFTEISLMLQLKVYKENTRTLLGI